MAYWTTFYTDNTNAKQLNGYLNEKVLHEDRLVSRARCGQHHIGERSNIKVCRSCGSAQQQRSCDDRENSFAPNYSPNKQTARTRSKVTATIIIGQDATLKLISGEHLNFPCLPDQQSIIPCPWRDCVPPRTIKGSMTNFKSSAQSKKLVHPAWLASLTIHSLTDHHHHPLVHLQPAAPWIPISEIKKRFDQTALRPWSSGELPTYKVLNKYKVFEIVISSSITSNTKLWRDSRSL